MTLHDENGLPLTEPTAPFCSDRALREHPVQSLLCFRLFALFWHLHFMFPCTCWSSVTTGMWIEMIMSVSFLNVLMVFIFG